jgi:hypothetical protein
VLLRAYLLHKKGRLPKDIYQEIDALFTDLQSGEFKDNEDEPVLRQALTQDLQEILKKYQGNDLTLDPLEDYVEDLYDWWNRQDGDEDWGDEDLDDEKLDPAADALLRALKSRRAMQDDFPAAPALPEGLQR